MAERTSGVKESCSISRILCSYARFFKDPYLWWQDDRLECQLEGACGLIDSDVKSSELARSMGGGDLAHLEQAPLMHWMAKRRRENVRRQRNQDMD